MIDQGGACACVGEGQWRHVRRRLGAGLRPGGPLQRSSLCKRRAVDVQSLGVEQRDGGGRGRLRLVL